MNNSFNRTVILEYPNSYLGTLPQNTVGKGERERERKKDTGTQALMEQRCFIQHSVGIYTVLQGSYSQQR